MLLLPQGAAAAGGAAETFDQEFFRREFKDGQVPRCELLQGGDVDVVELVLVNGTVLDVNCFEEFRRHYLVADVFVDPPQCDHLYKTYVRYDSVFQVNVRQFKAPNRKLGFARHKPIVEVLESVTREE